MEANPPYERSLPRLVALLAQQHDYAGLTRLGQQFGNSRSLDPKTVVLLAKGIASSGDIKLATQVLEGSLSWEAPTAEIYSALADLYRASGDEKHAAELDAHARTL